MHYRSVENHWYIRFFEHKKSLFTSENKKKTVVFSTPEFSLKTKKDSSCNYCLFFALCQKYLRTLALIELYHVGEARVKKLVLGRKNLG